MEAAWNAVPVFIFPWVERLDDETGVPELNTEGLLNWLGLIGTVCCMVLGIAALPVVRRQAYEWFYRVHIPMATGFIVMGALHHVPMQFFIIPGITALFIDRTDLLGRTSSSRFHRVVATTTIMTDDWVRLDLDMGHTELQSEGAAGTQWIYLRVPGVSGEWHPFSLAAHGPSVVIKGAGDWSKALHKLAVTTAQEELAASAEAGVAGAQLVCKLPVEIDGAYGHQAPPWQSYSHVLLIGGGVGVTPWLPLMSSGGGAVSGLRSTQRCSLIFTCKDEVEHAAMKSFLPVGQRTKTFLTRSKRSAEMREMSDDEMSPAAVGASSSVTEAEANALPAIRMVRGGGSAMMLAIVGTGTMLCTYVLYYFLIQLPEESEDDGGGMGGGGNGDGSGSDSSQPLSPPPQPGWKPTTLWSYFLIKTAAPVFGSFIAMVLLTVFTRWCVRKLENIELTCPMKRAPPQLPASAVGTAVERDKWWKEQRGQETSLAIPSVGHGVSHGRPDIAALVIAAATDAAQAGGGLYVCVCGPQGMVHSTRQAVAAARKARSGAAVGFHCEEPDW